ncbi:S9 family peptidase [Pseudoxanthomonas suwonensis]|uniref:S9 family peptidase n=1 Tax=Pseudoxanthomonas suwonensis TaxID=314722 RepID=UPI0006970AC7|nr:S9 family peptidase [Pseudoxanthomonas suwonensis]
MTQLLRSASLAACLATALLSAPASAAPAADPELEARIAAMGRVGSASGAQYSPDGRQIAYITNLSGVPQVWRIPAEGGYPRAVTSGTDPASGVRWSPDGRLAYAVSPGGGYNAALLLTSADGTGTRAIDDDGDANTFVGDFTRDGRYVFGSNVRDAASMDVWIWDPQTGKARNTIQMEGLGSALDIIGDQALVTRLVTRGNSNLWLDDLATGKSTLLTPHEGSASVDGLFGADASTVYLNHNLGLDRTVFARLAIGADGKPSAPQTLASRDDGELQGFALSDDKQTALLVWNIAGRNELERIDLRSGRRTPLPAAPSELVSGIDFAPDGRSVVLTLSGSQAPADLWRLDLDAGTWTRLTWSPHPGVDLAQLVKPELRTYTAHDGLELSGWLYLPKDFQAPGPVVLSFHGGPESQERPAFRADYQALLASGIGVFAPNIRGSSGFGKAFMQMDNHEGRFDANRDIQSTAEFLVREGIGDRQRLGIMGGSYGGYATMVGVTEFPETFAAAVNLFGMVNFETFFSQSTPWMGAISAGEYGDPKTQRQLLRDLSPIHKLDRVRTPLMVMHGANDTNVPLVEAEQIVDTLKQRGVDVEFVLFPDEGHGWRKEANRVKSTMEMTRFFREHLL